MEKIMDFGSVGEPVRKSDRENPESGRCQIKPI